MNISLMFFFLRNCFIVEWEHVLIACFIGCFLSVQVSEQSYFDDCHYAYGLQNALSSLIPIFITCCMNGTNYQLKCALLNPLLSLSGN